MREDVKEQGQHYFDARSATYDQSEPHQRIAHLLVEGADLQPGSRVLDVATGTGLVAFEAARRVGLQGEVVGIDLSPGMLAQARRKAEQDAVPNVTFLQGNAEHLPFDAQTFDRVLCCSALVLMSDVPAALAEWVRVLKPGGLLAFDGPDGQTFGLLGVMADVAKAAGVPLAFAEVTATPERCRDLLENAGLQVLAVRTIMLEDHMIPLQHALDDWERFLAHPVCFPLRQVPEAQREAIHAAFTARLTSAAQEGQIPFRVQLHLAFGQKPAETEPGS